MKDPDLKEVCVDLMERVVDLEVALAGLIKNHNELVQAVNDNTEFRADMIEDMQAAEQELEILFEPDTFFRDKGKDH